jgi:hypothetical protein
MKPEAAVELFAQLREADRALHAAYCLLEQAATPEQYQVYRQRLARVLSDTFLGVTRPLYEHFPALMPEEVRAVAVLPPDVQRALFNGRAPT